MEIKVITICGSMRYSKEMMKIAEELELKKAMLSFNVYIILMDRDTKALMLVS